jgi:hypothetical protein
MNPFNKSILISRDWTYHPLGEKTEQKCDHDSFPVLASEKRRPFGLLRTLIDLDSSCDLCHLHIDKRMLFFSTGVELCEDGPGFVVTTVGDKPSGRFRKIPPLKAGIEVSKYNCP